VNDSTIRRIGILTGWLERREKRS